MTWSEQSQDFTTRVIIPHVMNGRHVVMCVRDGSLDQLPARVALTSFGTFDLDVENDKSDANRRVCDNDTYFED